MSLKLQEFRSSSDEIHPVKCRAVVSEHLSTLLLIGYSSTCVENSLIAVLIGCSSIFFVLLFITGVQVSTNKLDVIKSL